MKLADSKNLKMHLKILIHILLIRAFGVSMSLRNRNKLRIHQGFERKEVAIERVEKENELLKQVYM